MAKSSCPDSGVFCLFQSLDQSGNQGHLGTGYLLGHGTNGCMDSFLGEHIPVGMNSNAARATIIGRGPDFVTVAPLSSLIIWKTRHYTRNNIIALYHCACEPGAADRPRSSVWLRIEQRRDRYLMALLS